MIQKAYAQTADILISKINASIINPIIGLLIALALLQFLWGAAEFIRGAESEDKRKEGSQHMLWGVVGITIMLSVFALMRFVLSLWGTIQTGR